MGFRSNLELQLTHCSEEGVEQHFLGARQAPESSDKHKWTCQSKWPEEEGRPLKPALKHGAMFTYCYLKNCFTKKNEQKVRSLLDWISVHFIQLFRRSRYGKVTGLLFLFQIQLKKKKEFIYLNRLGMIVFLSKRKFKNFGRGYFVQMDFTMWFSQGKILRDEGCKIRCNKAEVKCLWEFIFTNN